MPCSTGYNGRARGEFQGPAGDHRGWNSDKHRRARAPAELCMSHKLRHKACNVSRRLFARLFVPHPARDPGRAAVGDRLRHCRRIGRPQPVHRLGNFDRGRFGSRSHVPLRRALGCDAPIHTKLCVAHQSHQREFSVTRAALAHPSAGDDGKCQAFLSGQPCSHCQRRLKRHAAAAVPVLLPYGLHNLSGRTRPRVWAINKANAAVRPNQYCTWNPRPPSCLHDLGTGRSRTPWQSHSPVPPVDIAKNEFAIAGYAARSVERGVDQPRPPSCARSRRASRSRHRIR